MKRKVPAPTPPASAYPFTLIDDWALSNFARMSCFCLHLRDATDAATRVQLSAAPVKRRLTRCMAGLRGAPVPSGIDRCAACECGADGSGGRRKAGTEDVEKA